jgi:transcriptional regulator with XRE-family HTH domain
MSNLTRSIPKSLEKTILNGLEAEFGRRAKNNPRYSLRAYAASLGVDQSLLVKLMRGRRSLTARTAEQLAAALNLNLDQIKRLSSMREKDLLRRLKLEDAFVVQSEWYYFALLELMQTKDFRSDFKWMASRLGLSINQVKLALERLKEFQLVAESNGNLRCVATLNSWTDISPWDGP